MLQNLFEILVNSLNPEGDFCITCGIIKREEIHTFSNGKLNKNDTIKYKTDTIFEIGSITKLFTAFLIFRMINDGIADINDPVKKFLPNNINFPSYKNNDITIFHLLTHTSGLPRIPRKIIWKNFVNLISNNGFSQSPYKDYTITDAYNFLCKYQLKEPPGNSYLYSNLGYALLGQILEKAYNMDYESCLKKIMCQELDMQDTGIHLSHEQTKRFATGYSSNGEVSPYWDLNIFGSAGGVRSTATDLLKFMFFFLNQDITNLYSPLNQEYSFKARTFITTSMPLMNPFKRKIIKIGWGWHLVSNDKGKFLWHNGMTGGFTSFIAINRLNKIGIVILSNSKNEIDKISWKLLNQLI